ncbi:hypothetical protein ACUW9N_001641 [Staphylococcus auricularis]|nr:Uncharacterised protein [Staphylococcus auricularis]
MSSLTDYALQVEHIIHTYLIQIVISIFNHQIIFLVFHLTVLGTLYSDMDHQGFLLQ